METMLCSSVEMERTCELQNPKEIFEMIWATFCEKKAQECAHIQVDPLIFIIKPLTIEIINFKNVLQHDLYEYFFSSVIGKRVQTEEDIEGIAIFVEVFITAYPIEENHSSFEAFMLANPDAKHMVMLSLEWRNVAGKFTRKAQKVKEGNKYKLKDVITESQVSEMFYSFFDWDKADLVKAKGLMQ